MGINLLVCVSLLARSLTIQNSFPGYSYQQDLERMDLKQNIVAWTLGLSNRQPAPTIVDCRFAVCPLASVYQYFLGIPKVSKIRGVKITFLLKLLKKVINHIKRNGLY